LYTALLSIVVTDIEIGSKEKSQKLKIRSVSCVSLIEEFCTTSQLNHNFTGYYNG
jgi:hypothetical protein